MSEIKNNIAKRLMSKTRFNSETINISDVIKFVLTGYYQGYYDASIDTLQDITNEEREKEESAKSDDSSRSN